MLWTENGTAYGYHKHTIQWSVCISVGHSRCFESLEVDFVRETVEKLVRDHGVDLHKETIINSDYAEVL